jgi:hypothetical protein
VMQKLDIPYILSFDEFHRRMSLKTPFGWFSNSINHNYWELPVAPKCQ